MPRFKIIPEDRPRKLDANLVNSLVDELRSDRQSGQPLIYEQTFVTGRIRVLVIWDAWKDLPLEERTRIILAALEKSDGKEYRARVSLASGLTVPEAVAAGMLPYQIIPAHRRTDKVTLEQCREAMIEEGASELFGPNLVQLRFATEDSAKACRERLVKRLAKSHDIWIICQDLAPLEPGEFDQL